MMDYIGDFEEDMIEHYSNTLYEDFIDVEFINNQTTPRLWTSNMEFFNELIIYVPIEFILILQQLERETHNEFAFLLKFEEDLPNIKIIDWYFPDQRVSIGEVEILERKKGYEGVLHRHPSNIDKFSHVDWSILNKNYKLSLLYCDGRIVDCAYRIKVNNKYTWLTNFKINYIFKNNDVIKEYLKKLNL